MTQNPFEIFLIGSFKYYSGDNLRSVSYCKVGRNAREFVTKNNVPETSWIFARKNLENVWEKSDSTMSSNHKTLDRVFIRKKWFDENFKEQMKVVEKKIGDAPDIIELEDDEKFKDEDGNPMEIETRGEKKWSKIFFRAKHVGEAFGINECEKVITDPRRNGYKEDRHYKYLLVEFDKCLKKRGTAEKNQTGNQTLVKNEKKKVLFLTYVGILRMLFTSKSKRADEFVTWASETLFVSQMGTRKQKEKAAANLLKVTRQVLRAVLNTSAYSVPHVYLFYLGTVCELRKKLGIPKKYSDEEKVYKFGRANDPAKRCGEHENDYGVKGIELKLHFPIDPVFLSEAETKVKRFFGCSDCKFVETNKNSRELVTFDDKFFDEKVKDEFARLAKEYQGHSRELINERENLKEKLKNLEEKTEATISSLNEKLKLFEERYENERREREKDAETHKREMQKEEEHHKKEMDAQRREYELMLQLKDAEIKALQRGEKSA